MLYHTYQVHSDVFAPIRLMAEFFRGVLTQPWPLIENAPLVKHGGGDGAALQCRDVARSAGIRHPQGGRRRRGGRCHRRGRCLASVLPTPPFSQGWNPRRADRPRRGAAFGAFFDLAARHRRDPLAGPQRLHHRLGECAGHPATLWSVRSRRLCRCGEPVRSALGAENPCHGGVPAFGPGAGRGVAAGQPPATPASRPR